MKYRITGQNRQTGARMQLEFEAESKALAERKANGQGMDVHRVEDITDGAPPKAHDPHARAGTMRYTSRFKFVPMVVIVVAIAAVAFYFKDSLLHLIGH
jgi:hypothetical protein